VKRYGKSGYYGVREKKNGYQASIRFNHKCYYLGYFSNPEDAARAYDKKAIENTVKRLEVKSDIGGIARFEGDSYHHKGGNYPGNPWIITAMWLAQYYIEIAKSESDMKEVKRWINWAVLRANPAGLLAEQYDPYSGEHISASPLIWSHAEYVTTIVNYLEKLEELGVCKACYPIS